MCAPSAPGADGFVEMGAVPAGMECVDDGGQGNQGGRLIRMPGVQGRCEGGEEGGLRCEEGGRAWWTCAGGVWEGMGALAEGTGCVEGKIVGL